MTQIATFMFIVMIATLFWLNRDPEAKTSRALWLPVIWLWIAGSRPVSQWLTGDDVASAGQVMDGSPLDRNIYILLLALAIIVLVRRAPVVLKLLRENGPLVLFLFYCAVSIFWSDYPDIAFKRWFKSLGDYAMILIVLTDQDSITAIKRVLARVSFVIIPASILLIKYYPALGRKYATNWDSTVFFTGVTTDKNMLGVCCLIFGLGTVWRFLLELRAGKGGRRKGALIAHSAVLIMTGWLFAKANSMTSLACVLFGCAMMVVTGFPRLAKKRALVHTMVFAGLTFCFCVLFLGIGGFLLQSVGRNPTLTGRTELWDTIRGMTTNPVLGTGFESFWLGKRLEKLWSIYWWHPNEAHNGYLEMYLNLGWVGVALLAGIMINGYRNVIRRLGEDRVTGPLFLAFFFVGVAYNFTEAATRTMSPVWICLIIATIAFPKRQVALDLPERLPPINGAGKKRILDRTPEQIPA
jgi:exopolysaccharide production protein ExoQ